MNTGTFHQLRLFSHCVLHCTSVYIFSIDDHTSPASTLLTEFKMMLTFTEQIPRMFFFVEFFFPTLFLLK